MRHKIRLPIFACLLAILLSVPAMGQTLADMAREARKNKPATPVASEHVYTNESLNLKPAPSIGTDSAADKGAKKDAKASDAEASSGGATADSDEASPEDAKKKQAADFKEKIEAAKTELAQLQRELDVRQREDKLRVAQFYSDAGNRLRNEKQYAEDTRKNQAELEDKQKKIADTQSKLDKLRDEARRAGLSPGQIP